MKEMNSDRHSCTVSLASFAILALPGRARFMMRLMLAMGSSRSWSLRPRVRVGDGGKAVDARLAKLQELTLG